MEDSLDEITEFFSCNLALSPDPNTAGMSDDLADHVLRLTGRSVRVLLPLPTNRPLGDVVRPYVGRHAGWGLAETEIAREMRVSQSRERDNLRWVQAADGAGGSDLRVLEPLPVVGMLL